MNIRSNIRVTGNDGGGKEAFSSFEQRWRSVGVSPFRAASAFKDFHRVDTVVSQSVAEESETSRGALLQFTVHRLFVVDVHWR